MATEKQKLREEKESSKTISEEAKAGARLNYFTKIYKIFDLLHFNLSVRIKYQVFDNKCSLNN